MPWCHFLFCCFGNLDILKATAPTYTHLLVCSCTAVPSKKWDECRILWRAKLIFLSTCICQENPCCCQPSGIARFPFQSTSIFTTWPGRWPPATRRLCIVSWRWTNRGLCWRRRRRDLPMRTVSYMWCAVQKQLRRQTEWRNKFNKTHPSFECSLTSFPSPLHSRVWEADGAVWASGGAGCRQGRGASLSDPPRFGFHHRYAAKENERLQWRMEDACCSGQVKTKCLVVVGFFVFFL